MSSKKPRQRFDDIVKNIDAIVRYTSGLDRTAFLSDQKTIDATERCLARISEAAVKLGPGAEQIAPGISWADIRGVGNWLRHGYDEINQDTVWEVVSQQLRPLREASIQAIARSKPPLLKRRRSHRSQGGRPSRPGNPVHLPPKDEPSHTYATSIP